MLSKYWKYRDTLSSKLSIDRMTFVMTRNHFFLSLCIWITYQLSYSQLNQPASDLLDWFLYRWFEVFSISKQCHPVARRCWWVYQTLLLWFCISKIPKYVYHWHIIEVFQYLCYNYVIVLCMVCTQVWYRPKNLYSLNEI